MSSSTKFQSIWEYKVKTEYLAEFIKAYSPDGDWSKLFQKCKGYIKTELIQDIDHPHRFVTIDYWRSRAAYSAMKERIGDEYNKFDKQCGNYTVREKHLGYFQNR